jgi:hypothetical protein
MAVSSSTPAPFDDQAHGHFNAVQQIVGQSAPGASVLTAALALQLAEAAVLRGESLRRIDRLARLGAFFT